MRVNRIPLAVVLLVVALILQVSLLARLRLPGAVPDLMLLVVLGQALVYGPLGGCLIGFFGGLLTDFAPPADHAAGRYALVLCLVGYAAGMLRPERRERAVLRSLLVVAGAAIVATLLYAAVGELVGDSAARHVGLPELVVTAVIYDLVLAPFVVPGVMALARRTERRVVVSADAGAGASGPAANASGRSGLSRGMGSGRRKKNLNPRRYGGQLFSERTTARARAAASGRVSVKQPAEHVGKQS